jgi:bacterioferritin-associated ferredoxin
MYEKSYMDPAALSNSFVVELVGCDRIEVTVQGDAFTINVIGCSRLLNLLTEMKTQFGLQLKNWVLPEGASHEVLLVREMILKARGEWQFPYPHLELCHCRTVLTHAVDQAILLGAHTPAVVSRRTSASTACGTCRPDVEKIISYRLNKAS